MKPYLTKEEIPQEVIDDIRSHFEEVIFTNYGNPITENCELRTATYSQLVDSDIPETTILDPETLEPRIVYNAVTYHIFIVHGEFSKNRADIYGVIKMPPVARHWCDTPLDENPIESNER